MSTSYVSSYYLSPPQSPPVESPQYQQQQPQPQPYLLHQQTQQQQQQQYPYQQQQLQIPQHHDRQKPPLLSVKVIFESGGSGTGNSGSSGRRVSIGFRTAQQAAQYGAVVRSKTIHHTERLACKVQGRYASLRLPSRVTEVVACLAGPLGAGASDRVGGFYFVFSDPVLAQEWQDCLPLWRYVQGSRRKLYVERDVRDEVLHARLGMTAAAAAAAAGGGATLVGGGMENENYHLQAGNLASPVSLLSPSKTTTEEVVTIYSAEGEEVVGTGLMPISKKRRRGSFLDVVRRRINGIGR
ncbi:hypothetical protein PG989_013430 [Apiospora arundinis]|uniref:Uncharacterized protein n=1 Tax=Apiospora arundinis TaxID=335852 RepID=A0ABR2IFI6_9PEZI